MSVNERNTKLDARRFGDLHKAYHDRVLNSMTKVVGDRQAAEEITATAFAKALEHLATFRGEASFYTWLQAMRAMRLANTGTEIAPSRWKPSRRWRPRRS